MAIEGFIKNASEGEEAFAKANADVRDALLTQFTERPAIGDLLKPEGLSDILTLATHPFYSKASVGINYNALNGKWEIEIGSKVRLNSNGPTFAFALAVALLKYHGKNVPESTTKFIKILEVKR
jgi:hypothetical protein